jgi:outer membrane lipoprotein carrier protein
MRYLTLIFVLSASLFAQIILPTSFSANFKQSVTNPKKKKINYSGKLTFSTKNGIKWLYQKPTQKDVCSDKMRLIVVDHDLEQVAYYRLEKAINLEKIIKNAKFVRKSVYTAKYDGKQYTLQVNTKGELSRIAYFDDLENTVLIIFSHVKYSSKEIPKSRLKCKIPKAYDTLNG